MKNNEKRDAMSQERLVQIKDIVSSIKYGSVTLVIQDGILLQIEKNEKIRLK